MKRLSRTLLFCASIFLQACGGIIPTPFDKQKDPNVMFPASQSVSVKTVVARVDQNALTLGLKYTGTAELYCLVAADHSEFNSDLAALIAGNLSVGGNSYSCVLDKDSTTLDCVQPADATEYKSFLNDLLSNGSVSANGNSYNCIDASALSPLPI